MSQTQRPSARSNDDVAPLDRRRLKTVAAALCLVWLAGIVLTFTQSSWGIVERMLWLGALTFIPYAIVGANIFSVVRKAPKAQRAKHPFLLVARAILFVFAALMCSVMAIRRPLGLSDGLWILFFWAAAVLAVRVARKGLGPGSRSAGGDSASGTTADGDEGECLELDERANDAGFS